MVANDNKETVVRVRGLRKRYGRQEAVSGVDLDVHQGEIYGLIGPDAAGKSSLMKAIAGVLSYDAGVVEVFDSRIDSERRAERIKSRIGFLPQGLGQNLYPDLSVDENLDFFARLRLVADSDVRKRKNRLLAMTRLAPFRDRSMKHLSGGMKQKLGLICTLIHGPELLILDEPTTGVDPVSRRDFWTILSELVEEQGLSALVSTAYMDEAARFHRLSFLFQGRVLACGRPSEIHALSPGSIVTVQAVPQIDALLRLKKVFPQVETVGPTLRVFVDELSREAAIHQVRTALEGLHVHEIGGETPDPEDAFVALLRRQKVVQESGEDLAPGPSAGTQNEGSAIEARELIRQFGEFRAVDRVSFQVNRGEIFGLLGSNGAGKTTVIKMLTGILKPTGGEGWVAGANMLKTAGVIKERIGYMSQAFSLYLDLTVVENIQLFAGVYGLGSRETALRLNWLLNMAGLTGFEATPAGRLPMGVRQRLALGCALVHRPRVLFLDEPTSGVDPIGRRRFWEILLRLSREEGVAILVTTHYMGEAEHCDRLALMYAGRVVSEGSPSEMKEEVQREAGVLLELVTEHPLGAISHLQKAGFPGASVFGTALHVFSHRPEVDAPRIRQALADRGVTVQSITQRPLSLEDVFVHRILALEKATDAPAVAGRS